MSELGWFIAGNVCMALLIFVVIPYVVNRWGGSRERVE